MGCLDNSNCACSFEKIYKLASVKFKSSIIVLLIAFVFLLLLIYYFLPYSPLPAAVVIDKIVVLKSRHRLLAYSGEKLIRSFTISLGRNSEGTKEYEGDYKTPEGLYTINDKNPNSQFQKSLGISYPNKQDLINASRTGKPAGGDIKIHGLRNDQGYFGRFQRWRDWTSGCIALTNEEIDDLYSHTPVGTPIEIKR